MPTYLLLNSESEFPQDWMLPEETDPSDLRQELRDCMRSGEVLEIKILVGSEPDLKPSVLLINGSKLASATVVDAEVPPR